MNGSRAMACLVGSLMVAGALGGCGPAKEGPMAPVFYPAPPDVPRLQYLTTIKNVEEWQNKGSSFSDFRSSPAFPCTSGLVQTGSVLHSRSPPTC